MIANRPRQLHSTAPLYRELLASPDWVAEPKLDGWRCLVHVSSAGASLWTRQHTPMRDRLGPLLTRALVRVPHETWIDGEWIPRARQLIAWDCPMVAGIVVDWPLAERRAALEQWLPQVGAVRCVPRLTRDPDVLHRALAQGHEGLVLKRTTDPYWAVWWKVKS